MDDMPPSWFSGIDGEATSDEVGPEGLRCATGGGAVEEREMAREWRLVTASRCLFAASEEETWAEGVRPPRPAFLVGLSDTRACGLRVDGPPAAAERGALSGTLLPHCVDV